MNQVNPSFHNIKIGFIFQHYYEWYHRRDDFINFESLNESCIKQKSTS